jgi:hypothetical protein
MLTRRNRDQPPQKTRPTPFATKAKDLGAVRDAVPDAFGVGTGSSHSNLFVLFYFAIAEAAVTPRGSRNRGSGRGRPRRIREPGHSTLWCGRRFSTIFD